MKERTLSQQTYEVESNLNWNEILDDNTINLDEVIVSKLENDILNMAIAWRKGI